MKLNEIAIRDPFILPHEGKYYLFGTPAAHCWTEGVGFWVYVSEELETWSDPIKCFTQTDDFWSDFNYWAPEVHYYNGKFYMFASFYTKDQSKMRATQILVSDLPEGPYVVHSEPITPPDWMCLDGTFYVENGTPYMVFCHEWVQVTDGEICAVELSKDLTHAVGEPRLLFKASQPEWAKEGEKRYVTDGPFLYKSGDKLLMLWSSLANGYIEAIAYSDNGSINGNWKHCKKLLSAPGFDGGHGMLFKAFDGTLYFTMHAPNNPKNAERPHLFPVREIEDDPFLEIIY
ncbi:MAG: family 43 glycosylhydrolase [Clostridia bacterium]|nr:family 43 glycosylhydrolase [Clostridia bacterium]